MGLAQTWVKVDGSGETYNEELEKDICPSENQHHWVLEIIEGQPYVRLHPSERDERYCNPIRGDENQILYWECEITLMDLDEELYLPEIPIMLDWDRDKNCDGNEWHDDLRCDHSSILHLLPVATITEDDVNDLRDHISKLEQALTEVWPNNGLLKGGL